MRALDALFIAAAIVGLPAMGLGADCPTPKRLTCAELKARVAQRCPPEAQCVGTPGPKGDQGPQGTQGQPGPAGAKGDPGEKACCGPATEPSHVPHGNIRPLAGDGFSYGEQHNLDWHLFFGGIQFAPDHRGGNWQIQVGPDFQHRDALDTYCPIGCKTCGVHINGSTDRRVVFSDVYVF